MKFSKDIDGTTVIIKPQGKAWSVALLGDYCSNFGRFENNRLSMEWDWGLTPKVKGFIKSKLTQ